MTYVSIRQADHGFVERRYVAASGVPGATFQSAKRIMALLNVAAARTDAHLVVVIVSIRQADHGFVEQSRSRPVGFVFGFQSAKRIMALLNAVQHRQSRCGSSVSIRQADHGFVELDALPDDDDTSPFQSAKRIMALLNGAAAHRLLADVAVSIRQADHGFVELQRA